MSETDHQELHEHITNLLILSKDILKTNEKLNLQLLQGKNPISTSLDKYTRVFEKTEVTDHIWSFNNIYDKNKTMILRGPGRDSWLRDRNVTIQYGEDTGLKNNIKIHLSSIYNTACKVRDDIEESLHGLPNVEQSQELSYPTEFLLSLYKIFNEIVTKKSDRQKLANYIGTLERDLGKETTNSSGDGMDGMMNMATGLMEQMGIKMPPGQKLPSGKEISNMFGQMMNNPQTKSMLGSMMEEMKGSKNIGEVAAKMLGALSGGNLAGMVPSDDVDGTEEGPSAAIEAPSNDNGGDNADFNDDFSDDFAD